MIILCCAAKKPVHNTCEYIDRKKGNAIFHLRSSVLPLRNMTIFTVDMLANVSVLPIPHLSEIASSFPEIRMRLQKLA